jgi:uncharacterized protein DUF397
VIDRSAPATARDRDGWFKSSYSNGSAGSCVEVKPESGTILVRDSKDRRVGQPIIGVPSRGWDHFLNTITRSSL